MMPRMRASGTVFRRYVRTFDVEPFHGNSLVEGLLRPGEIGERPRVRGFRRVVRERLPVDEPREKGGLGDGLPELAQGFEPPPGHDFGRQQGTPFAMTRAIALSPLGLLCNKPPWGEMVAVDLKGGKILWRSRVGTM